MKSRKNYTSLEGECDTTLCAGWGVGDSRRRIVDAREARETSLGLWAGNMIGVGSALPGDGKVQLTSPPKATNPPGNVAFVPFHPRQTSTSFKLLFSRRS